ncbi:MAG: hypothetical protein JW818_16370 [Pirellulales bacterium]|nr:hypothetical protein [Pirellulales bacterium]
MSNLLSIFPARGLPCIVVAVVVAAICPGCSEGRYPVQGAVTFDGKPIDEGTITFEPADGQGPTTGARIVAGKYELTGDSAAWPGKKTVRIIAVRKTGRKVRDEFSASGAMIDEVQRYIPDIYNTNSTLSCEVTPDGLNQIDFHLKSR